MVKVRLGGAMVAISAWGGLGPVWRFCPADPRASTRCLTLRRALSTSRLRRRGQPGAAMVKLKLAKQLQAQRDAAARKHTRVRRPDIVYSACI